MNKPVFNLSHASEAFIERVVNEVVRRLKGSQQAADNSNPNVVSVSSNVVTLADLEGKLAAATQVAVPSRAIVTPAVTDELRRRNITLVRGQCSTSPPTDAHSLLLATAGVNYQAKGIAASHVGAFDHLCEAVQQLAAKISSGDQAMLLTNDPHAAACLANRHNNLRAIVSRNADETKQARQSIGCNFAAVNPAEVNPFMLKKIAAALTTHNDSRPTYFHQLAGGR